MAIWPFGRKSKRHTIQVTGAEAADLQASIDQNIEPTLGRKSSRRQSNRTSRGDADSRRSSALVPSNRPISSLDRPASLADQNTRERPLSRTGSLLRRKPSQNNGPNKLRRKLSKRKANEIMREREIRMLSSTPIDIPHRQTAGTGDYVLEHRRRKANGRRADRYMSDISLSIRDSAGSSASDMSDPYTYKVNAFAALTPRPVVRYVEAPRLQTTKSNNPSSKRHDKERLQALTASEEDLYYSRRRVNELADSLDAGALRELLDRDRRRREKKQIDNQEKLRRKLQERADAQQAKEEQAQAAAEPQPETEPVQSQPSVAEPESPVAEPRDITPMEHDIILEVEEPSPVPREDGSWLRGVSKASDNAGRESLESSRVIGNIDDSSVRERRLVQRPSFARSHDITASRTTLSPSHSSIRHGLNSPSHSQNFGAGSTSDISRGVDSERRSSDTSGRRGNTISSLFRRGSSRIKRRYKERFQDQSPEVSNASHESFYKIQTQSSPPPASILPPRILIPSVPIQRAHSKFTEHFGDEPLSPPDSRLQSPDIPEEVPESSLEQEATFFPGSSPVPVDIQNPNRSHHRSWTSDLIDAESENAPLSQSLASIDSEGSWMSGQFFKRMSQTPSSPVRSNLNSFGRNSADVPVDLEDIEDMDEQSRPSSVILGDADIETENPETSKSAERWHNEVGRRPVLVNPVNRPKSNQGLLRSFPSLTPISAEEDYMEETSPSSKPSDLQRVPSAKAELDYAD
jgi:hypothetical protein